MFGARTRLGRRISASGRWLGLSGLLLAACLPGNAAGPGIPTLAAPTATATIPAGVPQVHLPDDARPHDSLTEWWYYTGHLDAADGRHFGFEYVFFQSTRARQPIGYAAHLAVTDPANQRFFSDQRTDRRPAGSPLPAAFDLTVQDWRMFAEGDAERLRGAAGDYGIDLRLTDRKPAALHQGTGLVDFGPAGLSYYYSRTRLDVAGTLTVAGQPLAVTGSAWMDHQWGNFLVLGGSGGGGWDWFAFQLADGRDLMISLLRDAAGNWFLPYGTLVEADGRAVPLAGEEFTVDVTDRWTSPHTGAIYPAGWRVRVPNRQLDLTARPILADQEMVTTESSGAIYWEGAVDLLTTSGGQAVGRGYIELTGYAPAAPDRPSPDGSAARPAG